MQPGFRPGPIRTNEGAETLDFDRQRVVRFRTYTQQYSGTLNQSIIVPVERWVNALSVKNAGNTVVVLMGDPLQPGETKSIGGNAFEIYDNKHMDIVFTNPNGVVAPVFLCIVTQKFYVDMTTASSV